MTGVDSGRVFPANNGRHGLRAGAMPRGFPWRQRLFRVPIIGKSMEHVTDLINGGNRNESAAAV